MGKAQTPTLIYLHIPKCAGTSMMTVLRANYGNRFCRVGNGGGWRKFKGKPGVRCLTGHIPWGLHEYLSGPYQYAVMLRNPVDRVASLYWFCRMFVKHKYHKQASRRGLGWFVQSGLFADLDNGMTRWLAGRGDVGSLKIDGPLTDDDLRLAKVHVKASSVGFVETFVQSVQTWAREFGWTDVPLEHRMRGNYPGPTKQQRRLIRERNAMDVELYEWARVKCA